MGRTLKPVYFNSEKDADLIAYLKGKNLSAWVKEQLRRELGGGDSGLKNANEIMDIVERMIEAKLAGCMVAMSQPVAEHADLADELAKDILNFL